MAPAKIRRFYKEAKAAPAETGAREFTVLLDGRPVKTPGRRALVLPSLTLAEAVAEEWSAQDAELVPQSMPEPKRASTPEAPTTPTSLHLRRQPNASVRRRAT